ncbi:MAG: general secretion pathway protein GspK [Verrucomicrobia bacterium]|nr:general secretion pathway protein GspK [Verrucomicrobiota bacterium]MBU1734671.1 general secretion pathway protein GspK [Verrucomicrobiota bacterium]MBU1856127.1 general secretion pathway protein GspK [Verrucomicrobiota bacterium]
MKTDDRRQTPDDGLCSLKTGSPRSEVRSEAGVLFPLLRTGVRHPASGVRLKDGSALIVVLWVVGLLSMFVMAFAFDMHVEARITSSWRKKLKAEYLAKAGVELAHMMLFETADPDINNPDISVYLAKGLDEKVRGAAISIARGGVAEVTRELGAGTVNVTVRPENARISLKDIIDVNDREKTYTMWEPLFESAGVPFETRDALIDCLLDWVDQDEMTHLSGVESEYYESLDPPYQSKNAALDTVDELALIKGFDEKLPESEVTIYQVLSGFLTTYATDQKININAVDRNTMMGFLGIDAQLADEIIAQRQGPDLKDGTDDDMPFKSLADLLGRVTALPPGVAERISFKATGRFSILVRGKVGDIEHAVACVVSLAGKNLTILRWIEGDALQENLVSH